MFRTYPYIYPKTYNKVWVQNHHYNNPQTDNYQEGNVTPKLNDPTQYRFTPNNPNNRPVDISSSIPILSRSYFKFLLANGTDDNDIPEVVKVIEECKVRDPSYSYSVQYGEGDGSISYYAEEVNNGDSAINNTRFDWDIINSCKKAICDFGQSMTMFLKSGSYPKKDALMISVISGSPSTTLPSASNKWKERYDTTDSTLKLIDNITAELDINGTWQNFSTTCIHGDMPAVALASLLLTANDAPRRGRNKQNKNFYAHTCYDSADKKKYMITNACGIVVADGATADGRTISDILDYKTLRRDGRSAKKRRKKGGFLMIGGGFLDDILMDTECDYYCLFKEEKKVSSEFILKVAQFIVTKDMILKFNAYQKYLLLRNDYFGLNIDLIFEPAAAVAIVANFTNSEEAGAEEEAVENEEDITELDIISAKEKRKIINNLEYDKEFYERLIIGLEQVNINNKLSIDNYYQINKKNFVNLNILINNDILFTRKEMTEELEQKVKNELRIQKELGVIIAQAFPLEDTSIPHADGQLVPPVDQVPQADGQLVPPVDQVPEEDKIDDPLKITEVRVDVPNFEPE